MKKSEYFILRSLLIELDSRKIQSNHKIIESKKNNSHLVRTHAEGYLQAITDIISILKTRHGISTDVSDYKNYWETEGDKL